jgi:hypothetical protein
LRFIATIVSLIIAALLLILGISFKFFSGPTVVSMDVPVSTSLSYIVIDHEVLELHPGSQRIEASGAKTNTVGYGQIGDVTSWLGGSSYTRISVDPKTKELISTVVSSSASTQDAPTAAAAQDGKIVSPAGSDMWIGESTESGSPAALSMRISSNEAVIVSSDGTEPAPAIITVSWPLPKTQFLWMTDDILMIAGGAFLLLGITFYLWALWHMRRGPGPRRRGRSPRLPRPPRAPRSLGRSTRSISGPSKGRRSTSTTRAFIALALSGAVLVGVSACSTSGVSAPSPTPTSTKSETPDGPRPVITEEQLAVILGKVTTAMDAADKKSDANIAATRFSGAALEARVANYAMRKTNAKIAALPSLRPSPVQLFLPQATNLWPRSVLAMVQAIDPSAKEKQAPTVAVVMTQQTPRSNYKVEYTINLEANQQIPEVAAATAGTPLVALDTKLLTVSPKDIALAYGDILNKGSKSKFYKFFNASDDKLRSTIAAERKSQSGTPDVSVAFADTQGAGPVAFAAQNAGAIVAVQMNEVATFTPLNNRDLKLTGALKALAGLEISNRVVHATYGMQLFFYVPPVGSNRLIEVLGYSENLTSVKAQE